MLFCVGPQAAEKLIAGYPKAIFLKVLPVMFAPVDAPFTKTPPAPVNSLFVIVRFANPDK